MEKTIELFKIIDFRKVDLGVLRDVQGLSAYLESRIKHSLWFIYQIYNKFSSWNSQADEVGLLGLKDTSEGFELNTTG